MNRWMYRAQLKPGTSERFRALLEKEGEAWQQAMKRAGAATCSVFACGETLFVYLEAAFGSDDWHWPGPCEELLETWPGAEGPERRSPMPNVFYDGEVAELQRLRANRPAPPERIGSLARLKPDMYGSYVFYHYQLQEEKLGSFNWSYCIGSHEWYLFSYCELPALQGTPRPGKLTTNRTPSDWHDVMAPHFEEPWQRMELWFAF